MAGKTCELYKPCKLSQLNKLLIQKGIILTTGTFSNDSIIEANCDGVPQIELVDGQKLEEMFEKVELGVSLRTAYEINLHYSKSFMD